VYSSTTKVHVTSIGIKWKVMTSQHFIHDTSTLSNAARTRTTWGTDSQPPNHMWFAGNYRTQFSVSPANFWFLFSSSLLRPFLHQLWLSIEHHEQVSINASPHTEGCFFQPRIDARSRHDQGSRGGKPSAPPLSYPHLLVSCRKVITLFCSSMEHLALISILAIPAWPYLDAVCNGVSPY